MAEYTCYANAGEWRFEAYDDKDALRLALYYCDGEEVIKAEDRRGFAPNALCLCKIDKSDLPAFEF